MVYADPGAILRLTGGLGPLQAMAVHGSMTWSFAADEGKTTIELTYAVTGYDPDGLDRLAVAVDGVLGDQLNRLKGFLEAGEP